MFEKRVSLFYYMCLIADVLGAPVMLFVWVTLGYLSNRRSNKTVLLSTTSGQMWNVPFEVVPYTGALGFLDPTDSAYYITVDNILPNTSPTRTFLAVLQIRSWDRTRGPCLYAGNRQAGPTGDIPEDQLPNDSVIEGEYRDYIVSGEYATDCFYCGQFDESRCNIVAPA